MAKNTKGSAGLKTGRFSLASIPGFPYDIYSNQLSVYLEQESWWKGYALENQASESGKTVDLYPLKLNPIISTVLKHVYILFGEVIDDGRPLVIPNVIPDDQSNELDKKRAEVAESALNHVWWENNGRSLMFENGLLSQIYGGCVFRASFVPWEWSKYGGWRRIPIRIERIHPKSFIGRPSSGDMFRLKEGWVVSDMPLEEARKWGYTGYDDNPTFVEYWSEDEHKTWINNTEVSFPLPKPDYAEGLNLEGLDIFNGINPFGFVPIVYVPHIRAGAFHGINAFDHLKGLIREINLRFADYGDAVNDDSHIPLVMRNVNGSPQVRRIGDGLKVVDIGSSGSISGAAEEPDIFEAHKSRSSTSMESLLDELIDQYRRDSFVPAVAEGEDEGSQRSGLTLATRFWPLTSHAGIERMFFSAGMDVFNSYLLRMMANKGVEEISDIHTRMRMKQTWAPMLPRDREADVQEWALRAQNNIGSIEHLMDLTRDIEDIPEEREKALKWIKDVATVEEEAKAKAAQKYPPPITSPFGGGGGSGNKPNATDKKPGPPQQQTRPTVAEKAGGGGGEK